MARIIVANAPLFGDGQRLSEALDCAMDFNHHTDKSWWPSHCRLCQRWQSQVICQPCMASSLSCVNRCRRCALPFSAVDDQQTLHSAGDICRSCEEQPPLFDHAVVALDYVSPWQDLIGQLKFHQEPNLAKHLAMQLLPHIWSRWAMPSLPNRPTLKRLRAGAPTLIFPVPLSSRRWHERGYNQSALIAKALGQALHIPVDAQSLLRKRHTERLMSLLSQERSTQIRGAFTLSTAAMARIKRRHVAIVDDVLTTGATANELARVLWQGGAREVSVWAIARTPLPKDAADGFSKSIDQD